MRRLGGLPLGVAVAKGRVTINTIARQHERFSSQLSPNFLVFHIFSFIRLLVAVMARSTLSALVALASLTLVAGQSTAAPTQTAAAATGVPTFPATPLVSELFPYTALVRDFCR
jgi:hypothetical protein